MDSAIPAVMRPADRGDSAERRYSPLTFWVSSVALLALASSAQAAASSSAHGLRLFTPLAAVLIVLGFWHSLRRLPHRLSLLAATSLAIAATVGTLSRLAIEPDAGAGIALVLCLLLAAHAAAEHILARRAEGRSVALHHARRASLVSTFACVAGAGSLLIFGGAATSFASVAIIGAPLAWLTTQVWLPAHLSLTELCAQRLREHDPGRRFGARVATVFGAGYSPLGPGTVGALAALPLGAPLGMLEPLGKGVALLVVIAIAVAASKRYLGPSSGHRDPQEIVIDESAGVLTALAFVPWSWGWGAAAFAAFRILDMWKPWPIRAIERRVEGAWGVVLDDVAAGLVAGVALWGLGALI
ncbi:MAG: phosphatidylglycerophosphatase A [Deltaproteobacteria bacterium]|nr:phosphatidylglycerophosphatase A [Deltaproteobacteria bacterium]